jgi:hypothetical protein
MADAPDDKLAALEALVGAIGGELVPGLSIARDNPGATPPTWSVAGGTRVLTFGLVDRTFFWTWDEGVSNHYSKDAGTMRSVIIAELRRFGHLV